MTFRIDRVWLEKPGWTFSIKGIEGAGVYGHLQTDAAGRGLYLLGYRESLRLEQVRQLLHEDDFGIPLDATRAQAARILALGLHRLGWGPEVDQLHQIIDPDQDA